MEVKKVVKVHRKSVIVLPKNIRDALSVREGTLLGVRVEGNKIVLKPLDMWDRVWKYYISKAEEAEIVR
jgi:AbrB family looped-hinge helix DNA binding protein